MRSASSAVARAAASAACCCSPLSVTRGAPAATTSPLSKCTRSTVSLTLAVTSTASRAFTVPNARMRSLKGCVDTTAVVTTTAGGPAPWLSASPPAPQATRARASRMAQQALGPERKMGASDIVGNGGKGKPCILSTRCVGDVCHEARARDAPFRSTGGALVRYGALWSCLADEPGDTSLPHTQDDAMIHENILDTIGGTPVVRLNRIAPDGVTLYVKVESFNPGGSVKDRLALAIILDAEPRGLLKPGDTVVEATSGNTGVALAMVCAARGYKFVATMAESFSVERRKLMRAYGAKVILTPAAERGTGMVRKARELAEEHGWFL